jgi:nucleoside 2-deoxyribosyltransferase
MKNCFVVMPFQPQLHYTYLYLKRHIEDRFPGVSCERGDDEVLTGPILEKIAGFIKQADVLIADVSGRNPNVFYELGMAHALEKRVILVTADDVKDAPTDIRAFEFIRYDEGPKVFLEKLDKALTKVLGNQFDELYTCVSDLFDQFRTSKQLNLAKVARDEFSTSAADIVRAYGMPKLDDKRTIATLFLISMVPPPLELRVTKSIGEWIEEKFGS